MVFQLLCYLFICILNTSSLSKNMEEAIINLSTDSYHLGTCFRDIHYIQALAYADEVGSINSRSGKYVGFNVEIDGVEYCVTLNQEPNGNGAILTSEINKGFKCESLAEETSPIEEQSLALQKRVDKARAMGINDFTIEDAIGLEAADEVAKQCEEFNKLCEGKTPEEIKEIEKHFDFL